MRRSCPSAASTQKGRASKDSRTSTTSRPGAHMVSWASPLVWATTGLRFVRLRCEAVWLTNGWGKGVALLPKGYWQKNMSMRLKARPKTSALA
eukprot:765572-Hanusia_phi.AAC.3